MIGPAAALAVWPPLAGVVRSVAVTVYEEMAEPPLEAGGVKATTAEALPAVAVPMVGAPGRVAGTTVLEARDDGPAPTPLVAVTVKVYVSPLVRPVTVIGPAAALAVWPPLAGVVRSVALTV